MFVGDAIRFDGKKISGPPDRFTPDMRQAVQSIGKISKLGFDVMLSGHGEPLKPNASDKVRVLRIFRMRASARKKSVGDLRFQGPL